MTAIEEITEPKIEEVGADELEEGEAVEVGEEELVDTRSRQSRSEKKSRKAMAKLGMKPVPGIIRVTVKKSKNVSSSLPHPPDHVANLLYLGPFLTTCTPHQSRDGSLLAVR